MTILKAILSSATLTHCDLVRHICIITGFCRRCCRIFGINTLPEHKMTYFLLNPLGTNLNNIFIFNFSICFLISPTTSTRSKTFAYRARSVVKATDARHRCQWTSGEKRFVHNPVKCSLCAFCRSFCTKVGNISEVSFRNVAQIKTSYLEMWTLNWLRLHVF